MTRDDLLDATLATAGLALHLAAAAYLGRLPPEFGLDLLLVVLPVLVAVTAAVVVLARGERRPLQVACALEWLLVLFTLPAFGLGLAFVPSAVVLSVGALRPRTARPRDALSSAPPAAG